MEISGLRLFLIILFILAAYVAINTMIRSYENTICVCKSIDNQNEGYDAYKNEGYDAYKNEGFDAYIGKNDLSDYDDNNGVQSTIIATDSSKPRIFLHQGYHTTPSERNMVNRDDAIMNPRHDDILRYNGPGCFESGGSEKIRRVQLIDKPHVDRCIGRPQIATVNTGRRLTLTADGRIVDQHVNYYIPQTYLGAASQRSGMPTGYPALDDVIRDNGEPADVDQIGAIPVNNYEGEPVPIGSIMMS